MEQNREPRYKPTHIWPINYDKGAMNIQWGNDSLFNNWCWQNWKATQKRKKLDYCVTAYTKTKFEMDQTS